MSSRLLLRSCALLRSFQCAQGSVNPACRACPALLKYSALRDGCLNYQTRLYAKGKDKKKADKGKPQKIEINEELMAEVIRVDKMKFDMEHVLLKMKEDYFKNLSLRSTTGSIEQLKVRHEGKVYRLIEIGQVIRKNPKTITINMSSFPQLIPSVLKSISSSGLNLNPQQDGTMIFIPVPSVTREHRENLAKNAKTLFIKCRDSVKDVQNKYLKTIKSKEKEGLSTDVGHEVSQQVVQIGNQYILEAEKLMEAKRAELLKEVL